MKSLVFDAGPVISLTTNNLLWLLDVLKGDYEGEFYIPEGVISDSSGTLTEVLQDLEATINSTAILDAYVTQDVYENGDLLYIGMMVVEDNWLFKKIIDNAETGEITVTYAAIKNNDTVLTYAEAQAVYETLTYGSISEAI